MQGGSVDSVRLQRASWVETASFLLEPRYFNDETTYHFPRISSALDKLDLLIVAIHYDGYKPVQLLRERRYVSFNCIVSSWDVGQLGTVS